MAACLVQHQLCQCHTKVWLYCHCRLCQYHGKLRKCHAIGWYWISLKTIFNPQPLGISAELFWHLHPLSPGRHSAANESPAVTQIGNKRAQSDVSSVTDVILSFRFQVWHLYRTSFRKVTPASPVLASAFEFRLDLGGYSVLAVRYRISENIWHNSKS